MEIIWQILLTVCSGSACLEQDVQRFDTKAKCETGACRIYRYAY